MENNIIKHEEVNSVIATSGASTYSSIKPKTQEERKKLFNVLENCDVLLNDVVGQEVEVKDVIINEYPRKDKDTGEPLSNGHRTILIDTEGKSYVTTSNYFFVLLAKLLNTFGTPDTWEESMKIKISKKPTQNGKQALTFDLV